MKILHTRLVIGLAAFLGGCPILPAATPSFGSASVTWNASTSSGIIGYNLYYGTASRVYTAEASLGIATNATINGLSAGTNYYFAVTAVDSLGLESTYSNEQVFTVPTDSPLLRISLANGMITLTGSAPVGTNYNVMASEDMKSWGIIGSVTGSTNGSIQFTDPTRDTFSARYYRLKLN
jgi:hypothetical protein